MKRCFNLVIIIALSIVLGAACSNNRSSEVDSSRQDNLTKTGRVTLTISAAASLKDAMDSIQNTYQKENPEVILKLNYGSSGTLQRQISQGAPVDLFLSAAEDKFNALLEEGSIAKEDSVDLLGNELVLIMPKDLDKGLQSFSDLAKADIDSLSIGTPEIVPAGQYARQLLENIEDWQMIEPKIVYAKDVRQVLSYVETGNVDAGIVYKTDALISDKVKVAATANHGAHTPIVYPVGVIKDSLNYGAAKDFYHYLQSEDALRIFEEYGFTIK